MKIDWKVVSIGLLTAGWAYDLHVAKRNQKLSDARLAKARKQLKQMDALARLYADELVRLNVPIDRFTRIAMETIKEG